MAFKSNLLHKADAQGEAAARHKHDQEIIGRLYELVGALEAATGVRFASRFYVNDKYLGRAIENIRVHTKKIEEELDSVTRP